MAVSWLSAFSVKFVMIGRDIVRTARLGQITECVLVLAARIAPLKAGRMTLITSGEMHGTYRITAWDNGRNSPDHTGSDSFDICSL